MLASFFSAQSLKNYEHISDLGVEISLSHRHVKNVDFFRVKRINLRLISSIPRYTLGQNLPVAHVSR